MTYQPQYSFQAMLNPRGVVQKDVSIGEAYYNGTKITLPEAILRLVQTEYETQYGHQQDYERVQERGGFSLLEVITLLADLAERHGAKPS